MMVFTKHEASSPSDVRMMVFIKDRGKSCKDDIKDEANHVRMMVFIKDEASRPRDGISSRVRQFSMW